jgi:DNA-binding NarL/FixJ family response regulator
LACGIEHGPDRCAIRTLIVAGDALTRAGLRSFLRSGDGIDIVGDAATGDDAVRMASAMTTDVVVIDARLPDRHGMEVARQLVERADHPPQIVLLTTGEDDELAFRSMQTHISAYLPKRFTTAEALIRLVKVVATRTGQPGRSPSRQPAHRPGPQHLRESLTMREVEVLRLVAQGLTNHEIADELCVSTETVRTHVKQVYRKCGARSRTEAVLAAYLAGIIVRPRRHRRYGADG